MVVVVPAFTQSQNAAHKIVAAFVVARKTACAPNMANGVNAPGHVMHEEDAHAAAPNQAEQHPGPALGNKAAEHTGNGNTQHYPQREKRTDGAQQLAAMK